ncbi:tetratricopeptide repeat protein [Sulfurospirillum sp. 1612]|uniref:tetratricopeptide repeat protein n=1 Tax=Sulfurospirillum sp. 1612 TaxID=3094835 RepID=UPI002F93CA6A
MNNFFIEYRDPMFGIIILFAIIFIISFVNYWWGVFKSKEEKESIEKFVKKFEIISDEKEYKKLLQDAAIPVESLALLADAYSKGGDYEKSINIYLVALKRVKDRSKKQYILSALGKIYFKAGFLSRSAEVFLESLRIHPRNEESLKYLTVVYEKLKEYKKAIEVLDALEELGAKVSKQRHYINALQVCNDIKLNKKQKAAKLKLLYHEDKFLQRKYFEFLQQHKLEIHEDEMRDFEYLDIIDLLWAADKDWLDLSKYEDTFLRHIAMAKGYIAFEPSQNSSFELEVLGILEKEQYHKANLSFHYMCSECKNVFPIYFYRCPNCQSIATAKVQSSIVKDHDEENLSFL